jgi:hypothetical protein
VQGDVHVGVGRQVAQEFGGAGQLHLRFWEEQYGLLEAEGWEGS